MSKLLSPSLLGLVNGKLIFSRLLQHSVTRAKSRNQKAMAKEKAAKEKAKQEKKKKKKSEEGGEGDEEDEDESEEESEEEDESEEETDSEEEVSSLILHKNGKKSFLCVLKRRTCTLTVASYSNEGVSFI